MSLDALLINLPSVQDTPSSVYSPGTVVVVLEASVHAP